MTPRYLLRYARTVTVSLVAGLLSFVVHAHGELGGIPKNGRFTPNEIGAIWPPVPRATNAERLYKPVPKSAVPLTKKAAGGLGSNAVQGKSFASAGTDAARVATAAALAAGHLGERYELINTVPVFVKGQSLGNVYKVEFFSHSLNHTVRVRVVGGWVTRVDTVSPSIDQPPLGSIERQTAIDLARRYWRLQDNLRVDQLTGFSIQTFQPDGRYFENRMAYVTFHLSLDDVPELLTWVDLSNLVVVRGAVSK